MPRNITDGAVDHGLQHRRERATPWQTAAGLRGSRRVAPHTAFLLMVIAMGMSGNCEAQSGNPVLKVYAYEREIVGGIPGGPPGVGAPPRQTGYFIYLETPPKAELTVEGVWMKGGFHAVDVEARKAPVKLESPVTLAQDDKSIAVPATANKVTEIVVKDPVPGRTPDAHASKALAGNAAAVQLRYAGKAVLVPIKQFERRDPLFRK
jgi:hypothetical protein